MTVTNRRDVRNTVAAAADEYGRRFSAVPPNDHRPIDDDDDKPRPRRRDELSPDHPRRLVLYNNDDNTIRSQKETRPKNWIP